MKNFFYHLLSIANQQNKKSYLNYENDFSGDLFEVNNWIISDFIVDKIVPIVGVRPFPLNELQLMTAGVLYFKPDLIFDWGTHIGKSARIFYEIKKAFGLKSKIFSIDLPDNVDHVEHPHSKRGLLVKNINEVKLIQGDGVTEALKIYNQYKKKKKTLFLLDGDHEYKTILRELKAINRVVKSPVILIHDTFFQVGKTEYNVGPYEACIKFLANNKQYSHLSTKMGLPGMTLIYKK